MVNKKIDTFALLKGYGENVISGLVLRKKILFREKIK